MMRRLSERFYHRPRSRPVFLFPNARIPFSDIGDTSVVQLWTPETNTRLSVGEASCTVQDSQSIQTADQNRRCCRIPRFCGCVLLFLGGGSL